MLFRQQKSTFKKVQEIENFPKGLVHGFWPKNSHFSQWWFLAKSSEERTFFDIRNRKKSFLHEKSQVLKRSKKNKNFPKGVVHAFWQKMVIFLT